MKTKNGRKIGKRYYAVVDSKDKILEVFKLKKEAMYAVLEKEEVVPVKIEIIRNKGIIKR